MFFCTAFKLLCVINLLFPVVALSSVRYPSNMDLLVDMIEDAIDGSLADLTLPIEISESEAILIAEQGDHDANWLVAHILGECLLDRGFAVTLDSTLEQKSPLRLSFRILDLGIVARSGLRGKHAERQSRLTLTLRLNDEIDRTVYWQDEVTRLRADRIPKNQLELLQHSNHKFAQTELEEQSWSKFVEPVVVSTVLGGLVYLFFSNR